MTTPIRRIWHPWWKWECYPAGFYSTEPPGGMTASEAADSYALFLSDLDLFALAMHRVTTEWTHSSEHFLSNVSMNRVAWLGQSSMCIETGVPSKFRYGFRSMSEQQQRGANAEAASHVRRYELSLRRQASLFGPDDDE